MPIARESSATRSSSQSGWPAENTVIKILLAVFFALHVLAGALVQSRSQTGAGPARQEARTLYD